ncbi:hypothetical protein [Azospirillum sp. B510]|uniref:hypothetical protein n=1 Tax=Azospirillum sp. (strain B510) TaxID=137722 RepID=UPI0005AB4078|nr:hypothetical protein [Azospirillum sp. B510]
MSRCFPGRPFILATATTVFAVVSPVSAAPSTSHGQLSVAQLIQMLDMAPGDRTARQILTAYLAGAGEAASFVVHRSGASCKETPSLNMVDIRHAIDAAAARPDAAETPATPLIVRDMLDRAGCRPS